MSFPTHSTPCFTWHLPTDSLVFCAPALLLLGLTPETAPRTMADFLDRLPEPQRRFLQRQRQMALAGQGPGCLSCAYTYNGRHVREDLSIIQCDADGRPQTILGTFDVRHEASLPAGEDGGYWTYVRKEGGLLLDARCAGLLGLGAGSGPLDRAALRRLRRLYRAAGSLARLRRWLDIPLCSGRQSLLLMPSRSEELPLLLTASVLHRDRDGRALVVSGSLAPFLAGKAAPVGGADRLLLAMDACSDGLWDWDATTGKVYYSQNYLSMLGHTSETYPAELGSWVRAVHPDDYEKTVNMQMRVAASPAEGDAFSCTYRIRRADGSWLWVLGRGCVTSRDSEGRALRIVGMHTDISSLQHDRNPIDSIQSRLKSPDSILDKMLRKKLPFTLEAIENNIFDIAGIRVVCSFVDDIYMLADCLLQQDDITLIERKDYIKNPKKNGYRSLHLIIEVPIFLQNEKKIMKAEVQLRTIAMEFWANLEHQLRYKKDLSPELMEQTSYQLSECARLSAVLDEQMQAIRDIIEKEEDSSEKNDSPKKPSDRLSRPILSALENYAPKAE